MQSLLFRRFGMLSLFPIISGFLTVSICYVISKFVYHHHLPSWLWIPEISLLSCKDPERVIYQIGFSLTTLFMILFYFAFRHSIIMSQHIDIMPFKKEHKCLINTLKYSFVSSIIGLLGQGVVTMSPESLDSVSTDDGTYWMPDTKTIIHQSFAFLFFLFAIIHIIVSMNLYFKCHDNLKSIGEFKLVCIKIVFVVFVVVILSVLFIAVSTSSDTARKHMFLNVAGLCQWILVLFILLFFASYCYDHSILIGLGAIKLQSGPLLN